MTDARVNGVRLRFEVGGAGDVPVVLVHPSWSSRRTWDRVVPRLTESFRVLTYDRRGHSQSERPDDQGSIREDVADLAALIEHLHIAPAWVAGSSAGAAIALRLAGERPELLRGVIAHEPGFFSLLDGDPSFRPMLEGVERLNRAVVERIAAGAHAEGAEQFVEALLGPGAWAQMPVELRDSFVENAPTFYDDMNDPEHFAFELDWIRAFPRPVLLTLGELSPPFFAPVVEKLSGALPHAETVVFQGAGHTPYASHPEAYVEALVKFVRGHEQARVG